MIKLTKGAQPAILAEKGAEWLSALTTKLAAGQEPSTYEKGRYRHADIKSALIAETHGKCAYCEAKLLHIAFGDVEHIAPKSRDVNLTFVWTNLTLACDKCNTFKSKSEFIVDPYTEDPEELFNFIGPMILGVPNSEKAVNTEKVLQLNRGELVERRIARIQTVSSLIILIKHTKSEALRETLKADLVNNEMSEIAEFSAFVKSFVNLLYDLESL